MAARGSSPASARARPEAALPTFSDDAARLRWIATEYAARLKPGARKAIVARDLAALAFEIDVAEVCGPSRKREIMEDRHLITCIIRAITNASFRRIGHAIGGRSGCATYNSWLKHGARVSRLLEPAS